jgi:hypothetical protein
MVDPVAPTSLSIIDQYGRIEMDRIHTVYRPDLKSYVVSLPSGVSHSALKKWSFEFIRELQSRRSKAGLLFNTGDHDFESIDCLKLLKDLFTKNRAIRKKINRVAFVQPIQYRNPEVISDSEAYFSAEQKAIEWLKLTYRNAHF